MHTRLHDVAAADTTTVLEAARAGDTRAWHELVRRHDGVVRATAASYRLTPADAADAAQNTWLRLVEHAGSIRDPEKLGGWLTTTTRRECLATIRRQRAERPFAYPEIDVPSRELEPETAVLAAEVRRRVQLGISALPARPRALVIALYFRPHGNYAQIARDMSMPIGSIGPTRLRAIRCLRRSLEDLMGKDTGRSNL